MKRIIETELAPLLGDDGANQFPVEAGVTVLIESNEWHELVTHGETSLKFFAISQPAWVSEDHLTEADPS